MVSTWHFLTSESIWPLPHVLFAYHGYMYTRDWKSILCAYYIYKSLELFIFAVIGYAYYYYFPELVEEGNEWYLIESWYREFSGNKGGYDIYNETVYNNYTYNPSLYNNSVGKTSESFDNCHLDCNDLFVGGSVQTLVGILLGMIQAKLFSSKEKISNFHLITFWKDSFLKHDGSYFRLVKLFNHRFKKTSEVIKYGLWPMSIVLGTNESEWGGSYHARWEDMIAHYGYDYVEQSTSLKDIRENRDSEIDRKLSEENKSLMVERWYFRKFFWYRWFQITTLGFPATLFYTLKGSGEIKAGLIIYCFVSCLLLLFYKHVNENLYLNYINHGTYEDQAIGEKSAAFDVNSSANNGDDLCASEMVYYDHQTSIYFNNYEKFYILWIFTTTFLCAFQAIPILSSFYRVLVSSSIIIAACVLIKIIHTVLKYYKIEKKELDPTGGW